MTLKRDPTSHPARALLARAHSPASTTRIFTQKVQTKSLPLRPTDTELADAREQRRRTRAQNLTRRQKKQKPKPLTAKEKRSLGVYDIPPEARKYAIYEPLHGMWLGYIREVLAGSEGGGPPAAAKMCSADFHGAKLEVVRARCVSRVGVKGIVVKDTKFTFEVITAKNELKIIPKEHAIFRFEVPFPTNSDPPAAPEGDDAAAQRSKMIFELHGSQFELRATDRANKKFKQRNLPDL
ncbi:MAG: hypothetical protein M4579_000095 [Chaenotheca gracillima]|nr:MAG: hypothetical protein M4579_000095 [Chaenotheca gracillima]